MTMHGVFGRSALKGAAHAAGVVLIMAVSAFSRIPHARAEEAPAVSQLSLSDAAQLARARAYDVLDAQAAVQGAEASVRSSRQLPNPLLSASGARTLDCAGGACEGTPYGISVAVADQGLIEGAISRKRALREDVARRALEAARYGRVDAERVVVAQAKSLYVRSAAAQVRVAFAREVAASLQRAVEVNRVRYPRTIDEGQLARVEQEQLKAEQDVERELREARDAQLDLAVLLGMKPPFPVLAVDTDVLKFRVPEALATANEGSLLRAAEDNRPDRRGALAREAQADASVVLARRQRVPDVSLSVQYQFQGTGPNSPQPSTLSVGVGMPIPLLYQNQGEIASAEAQRSQAAIARRRVEGLIGNDVQSAFNAFLRARAIVERYERSLLERARRARDITEVQYNAGSATLTDLLDAQRNYVQANRDYYDELVNYWTAVFLLEQAVGKELTP